MSAAAGTPSMIRRGRAWRFGDLLNVDEISATRYVSSPIEDIVENLLPDHAPDFHQRARPGDLIVAGFGFGFGMGHDHPILGLMRCGITGIVAASLGPQFYRACIAHGLPVLELGPLLGDHVADGEEIEVDFAAGTVRLADGTVIRGRGQEGPALAILEAGGLVPFLREEISA